VDAGAARGASVAAWAAAATATGALALLSLADFEGATVEVGGVQRLHGSRGVGIRHLNEAETTRATRVTVDDQRHFLDGTVLGKQGATASSVAVNGRFPTYSLVTEEYSRINGIKPAGQTCFLVREACEGERVAGEEAPVGAFRPTQTSQKVTTLRAAYRFFGDAAVL